MVLEKSFYMCNFNIDLVITIFFTLVLFYWFFSRHLNFLPASTEEIISVLSDV